MNTIRIPSRSTDDRPFLVIWETTQACDLACKHCRADAQPFRHPGELDTAEGKALLRQVAGFGKPYPLVVLTGGDPFKREDLCELVSYGTALGLHVGVSPSATPLVTRESLARVREAGACTMSLSLDGSCPEVHDGFRGVSGTFERTLEAFRIARELGFKVQINTTVSRHNRHDLVPLAAKVAQLDVMTWSMFFLVPTGRAQFRNALSADELEGVLNFLVDLSRFIPVKTTEGHHYKRVVLMRKVLENLRLDPLPNTTYDQLSRQWKEWLEKNPLQPRNAARRTPLHINSGHGFAFVSHVGDVFPSGFLPIRAGSVLKSSLVQIYRESPLFQVLRDPSRLQGHCGACEFREICGGSRSRAFAQFANPLAPEPSCSYEPGSFPYQAELMNLLN